MRQPNVDNFVVIRDWFVRTYEAKQKDGIAKILLYDGHVLNATKLSEILSYGSADADAGEFDPQSAEDAWEILFEDWAYHLREFPKKFTLSIGKPDGGAPKKMRVTVVSPELAPGDPYQAAPPQVFGMSARSGNPAADAALHFDLLKTKWEKEQLQEALNAPRSDTRVGRLLDNLIETISQPEVTNALISGLMGFLNKRPAASVASAGFAAPEQVQQQQKEVGFRAKFADYGEIVKENLFGNERLVFQVMDNLVQIMADPEKVNKLITYVAELNAVDSTKDNFYND